MNARVRDVPGGEEEDDFVPPANQVVFDYDAIVECLGLLLTCSDADDQVAVMGKLKEWLGGWPLFLFEKMGDDHMNAVVSMVKCDHPCLIPALACLSKFSKFGGFRASIEMLQAVASVLPVQNSEVNELCLNILGNVIGKSAEWMTEIHKSGITNNITALVCLRLRTQKLKNWAMSQFLLFPSDFDVEILEYLGNNCTSGAPTVDQYALAGFVHALKWSHNVLDAITHFNICDKATALLASGHIKPCLCALKFTARLARRPDFDISPTSLVQSTTLVLVHINAFPDRAYHQIVRRCLKVFRVCAPDPRYSQLLFAQIGSVGINTIAQSLQLKYSHHLLQTLIAAESTNAFTQIPAEDLSEFIASTLVSAVKLGTLENIARFLSLAHQNSTWSSDFSASLVIDHGIIELLWDKAESAGEPAGQALHALAEMYEKMGPK